MEKGLRFSLGVGSTFLMEVNIVFFGQEMYQDTGGVEFRHRLVKFYCNKSHRIMITALFLKCLN